MIFPATLEFEHKGWEAVFRSLDPADVTAGYVEALSRQREYIENTSPSIDIQWQREYVHRISVSPTDGICGLTIGGQLVGTAGMQNVQSDRITTLGLFVIGESERGKGLGKALVWAGTTLAREVCAIRRMEAGMQRKNVASYHAFLSCGYQLVSESEHLYRVGIDTALLRTPETITAFRIVADGDERRPAPRGESAAAGSTS